MATKLKTKVDQSNDGKYFTIRDITTGWGDTYLKSDIVTASLVITGSGIDSEITYSLTTDTSKLIEYFTIDGHKVYADDLGLGTYFTDGYYEIKLLIAMGSADYYINQKAFIVEHRNRCLDLAETLEWPVDDMDKYNNVFVAQLLMDAAEAAGNRGAYTTFQYIINKINSIFEKYQYEALW